MKVIQEFIDETKQDFILGLKEYGIKLLIFLVIVVIGFKLIDVVVGMIKKAIKKTKMDVSLAKFIISFSKMALKISLILLGLNGLVGDLTPLLAIGAAAGVGIGMALQGSLANFMGGVLILSVRPFSVGDYISEKAFGNEGTVESIQVLYTTLLTKDNKTVIIPNGQLANSSVINFSKQQLRRIDLIFNVDYEAEIEIVKNILRQVANSHSDIVKKEEIFAGVSDYKDSGVDYILWAWCNSTEYVRVRYELIEQVKKKFDLENISIPYPRMDVHLANNELFHKAGVEVHSDSKK